MNFFRNFGNALKYANFNFSQLKGEIVELVQRGRQYGYDVPDYCKLTVKNSSKGRDYPVMIDLYYKENDEQLIHLPQELLIGEFSSMPTTIRERLIQNGFVEIVINNFAELFISASEDVAKPIRFASIIGFSSNTDVISSRKVTISDDIFVYRVKYSYDTSKKKNNVKVVSYSDITQIPDDVNNKLTSDGVCTIVIDKNA